MIHKMYCIFAMESVKKMNGNRGKLASMAGHAYLHSFWDSVNRFTRRTNETDWSCAYEYGPAIEYQKSGLAFKITLIVDTVDELREIQANYHQVCGTSLVTDAGRTVFGEPTTVCLGLGPIKETDIGLDLKSLKVFI